MRIINYVRRYALFAVLPVLALTSVGCDSGGDEEEDVEFTVVTQTSTCTDNQGASIPCIEFFGRPNADVILTKVNIEDPTGEDEDYNLGQASVIANESIALQAPNSAYIRLSGPWTFTFTGTRVGGGAFTATTTVNVSA